MIPPNAPSPSDRPSLRDLLAARQDLGSSAAAPGNPTREELTRLSVQDLRGLARDLGLTGYSQNRKAELVARLQAADRAARSKASRKSTRASTASSEKPGRKPASTKSAAERASAMPAAKTPTGKPALRAASRKAAPRAFGPKPTSKAIGPKTTPKAFTAKPARKSLGRKPAPKATQPKPAPKATQPKPAPKATQPKPAPKATKPKLAPKATKPKLAPKASKPKLAPKASKPKLAPKAIRPKSAPEALDSKPALKALEPKPGNAVAHQPPQVPPMPPPTEFARSPLGPPSERPLPPATRPQHHSTIEDRLPRHIPWGYGRDRVTAMAVDPQELYVYAEITDQGIEQGRRELGAESHTARLVLRVHDVTGRIFDGTNSLGFFDLEVDRDQRGWFLDVEKPGSTTIAEVGLRTESGRFHKIARSRRVDFARRGSTAGAAEWMTVVVAAGGRPEPVILARGNGHPATADTAAVAIGDFESRPAAVAILTDPGSPEEVEWIPAPYSGAFVGTEMVTYDLPGLPVPGEAMTWGWAETWPLEGLEHRESRWFVSPEGWSWIGGPFERWSVTGPLTIWEVHGDPEYFEGPEGQRIRYGRWSVEIKGIDGWAERRLLGRWSASQSWEWAGGAESIAWQGSMADPRLGGSSDLRWQGASERRWRGASELRLGGASEMIRRGASELRLGGASELIARGASERRWGYGSEQRWLGASERRQRGGSERRLGGASERRRPARPGGSEGRFPGASERRLGGASERHASRPPRRDDDAGDRRG